MVMETIQNFLNEYATWIIAIFPVLAAIAAVTPNEYDNKALVIVRKVLDFLAFNWGNASNEKPKEK